MTADLFPIEVIKAIIENNNIAKATVYDMDGLLLAWKTYVEPDLDAKCNICKTRILDNFKQLQPQFVLKLKNNKLLDN